MSYKTITAAPITPTIGAEIAGIDLSQPLSAVQLDDLNQAIADHQVIFFRDQTLDPASLKRVGQYFGELQAHALKGLPDHPEVRKLHADETSKHVAGEEWHTDMSCLSVPPMGSILYMHTLPPQGGDTIFASMYAAYESLSDKMKAYLEGLSAEHDANPVYKAIFPDIDRKYNCSVHPIVRTHPVSGRKSLFVNPSYTTRIMGLSKAESAAILNFLYQHAQNPDFQVRFRWKQNSVAFWDNRCTWHQAIWDYFPDTRTGYRVTVAGDKPV